MNIADAKVLCPQSKTVTTLKKGDARISRQSFDSCRKELCSWYNKDKGACAVLVISQETASLI